MQYFFIQHCFGMCVQIFELMGKKFGILSILLDVNIGSGECAYYEVPCHFVTHICHWLTALTEPFMIHHSDKSRRQCAGIWSDSLQLPWYSGCRLYDFRQLPTCLFTTSNFLTKTAIKTLGHLGRNLATTYGEKCQVRQDGQYGQFRQDRQYIQDICVG